MSIPSLPNSPQNPDEHWKGMTLQTLRTREMQDMVYEPAFEVHSHIWVRKGNKRTKIEVPSFYRQRTKPK